MRSLLDIWSDATLTRPTFIQSSTGIIMLLTDQIGNGWYRGVTFTAAGPSVYQETGYMVVSGADVIWSLM